MNDEKVIDRTIDYFETVYPDRNTFIVLKSDSKAECKYIRKTNNVVFCHPNSNNIVTHGNNTRLYKHVLIHMLDKDKVDVVNKLHHPNITWIVWGTDLYESLLLPRGYKLYQDGTILTKANLHSELRQRFKPIAKVIDYHRLKKRVKAIKKIRNITAIDPDYRLLIKYYPELNHLHRKDFFYYPIDAIVGKQLASRHCVGNDTIVGNSASPNGNHLYVLQKLYDRDYSGSILLPLSYGNSLYKEYIIKEVPNFSGLNVIPLLKFLSLDEYNKLLISCGNFVYGNLRQEAMGNILVAFYLGGKVFLDKKNPLFEYFQNLDLYFYSLDDIDKGYLDIPFDKEYTIHNRKIIDSTYNLDVLLQTIHDSFPI